MKNRGATLSKDGEQGQIRAHFALQAGPERRAPTSGMENAPVTTVFHIVRAVGETRSRATAGAAVRSACFRTSCDAFAVMLLALLAEMTSSAGPAPGSDP